MPKPLRPMPSSGWPTHIHTRHKVYFGPAAVGIGGHTQPLAILYGVFTVPMLAGENASPSPGSSEIGGVRELDIRLVREAVVADAEAVATDAEFGLADPYPHPAQGVFRPCGRRHRRTHPAARDLVRGVHRADAGRRERIALARLLRDRGRQGTRHTAR